MARLLPSSTETPDQDPQVVGLDGDAAEDLVGALSAGTARELLSELYDEPAAPSELADRVDTSLQNAQYHLENLQEADLIEVVDTVYSEKGREMRVFAPASSPLVVVAGRQEDTSTLRSALGRLLSAFAVLAAASLVVQWLLGGGSPETPSAGGQFTISSVETTAATGGLAPGVAFFLGGTVVLLAALALRRWRSY
jgi:DNA-binding transcriptional ArsR family regulator